MRQGKDINFLDSGCFSCVRLRAEFTAGFPVLRVFFGFYRLREQDYVTFYPLRGFNIAGVHNNAKGILF